MTNKEASERLFEIYKKWYTSDNEQENAYEILQDITAFDKAFKALRGSDERMTYEEALNYLNGVLGDGSMNYVYTPIKTTAIQTAIDALRRIPKIHNNGTLEVVVEDGRKIKRVLVCGDNNCVDIFYKREEEE